MAAITSAVVVAAGSAYAANRQASAAGDAADAQAAAGNAGIAEQRAAREQFQQNIDPYLRTGGQANDIIGRYLAGDQSAFTESPDYQWRLSEGQKGLDRSAASRGNLFSGGHTVDSMKYNSGMASTEFGNWFDRIRGVANTGANAAVGAGSLGQQSANAISGLYQGIGNAQANGAIGQANAWSNGIAGIGSAIGTYMGGRQSSYANPSTAFTPNGNYGLTGGYGNVGQGWGSTWGGGG